MEKKEVSFTFHSPQAIKVSVAGSFNNWNPHDTPLKFIGDGEWLVRLMLRSGSYEYRFVVDGVWMEDAEATARVDNTFGGFNSVLVVPMAVRTSIL